MHRILVLHGPNLNALGVREPGVYGRVTLAEIDQQLLGLAGEIGCEIESLQSNHEGVLIDRLHAARGRSDGVLLNPAGLTHTSVALRDAVLAAGVPVVEVHLTNPHTREAFRERSFVSGAALGVVEGFGVDSYLLGLRALVSHLGRRPDAQA
jgi:3-dehydroquinate dehydratase-2